MPNHSGADPRLDKQYQGYRQDQLVIIQWNANGIQCEVASLETVLASLQVDVVCIMETKLLPKYKNPEILQYWAVRRDCQIQGEASGGGPITYICATLTFSAIHPAGDASNMLEKLSVVIPLPEKQKILV